MLTPRRPPERKYRPGTVGKHGVGHADDIGLLATPLRILDVANAEAFVQRTIDRAQIAYSEDERQELLAEGLAIMLELAGKYKPLPPHGRFSGYAAMFLPRRLGDAWHSWHPDHSYVTDPATGKRRWSYGAPAASLDELTAGAGAQAGEIAGDAILARARGVRDFVPAATVCFTRPGTVS